MTEWKFKNINTSYYISFKNTFSKEAVNILYFAFVMWEKKL